MATDDERRRVAAELREYASFDCEDEGEEECLVDCADWGERVLNLLGCGDTEGECYKALAKLIEPPLQCPHYHSDRHYCSVHDDAIVDREALLETLSCMDAAVRWAGPDVERDIVEAWADDIREALGVGDA